MLDHTHAAYVFTFFTAIVVTFQLALALGVPWGQLAMGGKYPGKFPFGMRIAALVQILVLILFALVVLARAGVMFNNYSAFSTLAIWGVAAFCLLNAILNTITQSKWERIIWLPVTIVLFACSVYVALS
ncbi:MAG: hypothetical protein AMS22_06960 [Thiotrichales bacterium SG8_50]|nr:MAG: hypothetical protein AMS22_06960 [Thiotrichales bacterium SG8_50]